MRLQVSFDERLQIEVFEWTARSIHTPQHWHYCLEIGICLSGKKLYGTDAPGKARLEHVLSSVY